MLAVRQRVFFWIDESPMHVVRVKPFAHQLVKIVDAHVIDPRIQFVFILTVAV